MDKLSEDIGKLVSRCGECGGTGEIGDCICPKCTDMRTVMRRVIDLESELAEAKENNVRMNLCLRDLGYNFT